MSVTDNRRGMDELFRRLRELDQAGGVNVGLTHAVDGKVINYAADNEFGTGRIPSRPFMRQYYDHNVEKVNKFAQAQIKRFILTGTGSGEQTFTAVGLYVQKGIKNEIRTAYRNPGAYQPNAPATIAAKGSDHPLVDHGILHNTITMEIKR